MIKLNVPKYEKDDDINVMAYNYAVDLFAWADDLSNVLAWKWKRLTFQQGGELGS